jgi:hypothetical protein
MPATYVHLMIIGVACQEKKNKMSLRVRGGRGGFWQSEGVLMEKELTLKKIQFLKKDYSRGFIADVGYEAVKYERGQLESHLRVLTRHRQQDNYIHAGVIATMADHTAGYAAFS